MGKLDDIRQKLKEKRDAITYDALKEKWGSTKEKAGTIKENASKFKFTILIGIILIYIFGLAPAMPEAFGIKGNLPGAIDTPVSNYVERQAEMYVAPALQSVADSDFIGGVPLKYLGTQTGCWFGKSFVPSEVIQQQAYSPTKAWDDCKKFLVTDKADEIGCTNCYSITSLELETMGVKKAVASVTIDTPEGKEYCRSEAGINKCEEISPVKNPKFMMYYDSSKVTELKGISVDSRTDRIKLGLSEEVASEIGPSIFPLEITAFIPLSCVTKGFKPRAVFSYDYDAFGEARISLRKDSTTSAPTVQNPITFPGPIKLDVIPRPKDFAFDRDAEISVTIVIRNSGTGDAKINSVTLKQNPPLQLKGNYLTFQGCVGPYAGEVKTPQGTQSEKIEIPRFVSTLGKNQQSNNIVCSFGAENLAGSSSFDLEDVSTYSFEATADYTYQIAREGQAVEVDEVLTCEIPTTGWKTLQVEGSNEPEKTDDNDWKSSNYDDIGWTTTELPDSGNCAGCSRFYRQVFVTDESMKDSMYFNVASRDGAACYLNGAAIPQINDVNGLHELGKKDPKSGCVEGSSYDYCAKLAGLKTDESNVLACQVKSRNSENEIEFSISTDSEEYAIASTSTPATTEVMDESIN